MLERVAFALGVKRVEIGGLVGKNSSCTLALGASGSLRRRISE
jgi:hypothetical protein